MSPDEVIPFSVPDLAFPALASAALASHVQGLLTSLPHGPHVVCGAGFDSLDAATATSSRKDLQLAASCDVEVLLVGDLPSPPTRVQVETALARIRPGGLLIWLVPQARSAGHLERLLHLPQHSSGSQPLSLTIIAGLLEAHGFDLNPAASRILTREPPAAVREVAASVKAQGGDASALLQDASTSHVLLVASSPRRRAPDSGHGDSRRAIHDAVAGAVASGVDLGSTSDPVSGTAHPVGQEPRVSIVIPVFNGAELTEKCLYGVAGNTDDEPDYEVIVVDNGSSDWTMYLLHAMEGDLRVLSNDRNLGFARACNQGGAEAQGDYILFLNNDTVPHAHWLKRMVDVADADPAIGIVGARLLYPDGTVQHAGIELIDGMPDHIYRGAAAEDPRVTGQRDLDMVTGACLMIRRDLFEQIGGFDAQFLNGVEDVDLCLRAREQGYRVVYCGDAVIDHHEAQTQGRFDHVQENVRRFVERWGGRFDDTGRLATATVPRPAPVQPPAGEPITVTPPSPPPVDSEKTVRHRVNWEGSFFLHSSLAYVNREMALALLADGRCELGLVPFEPDQFDAQEDERFDALARRMGSPLEDADVHVRHRWPPELTRPATGRHVLMQPWEFGSVPRRWVEAVATGQVDQIWAYTSYVRDCYIDGGVDPARVAIVPPGVDPDRFQPGLKPHEAVNTQAGFRFLFVGGTLYRKGIDVLLQAFRDEFSPDEDVSLVIKDMGVNTFYRQQTAGDAIRQMQEDPACAQIQYLTTDLPGDQIPRLYAAAHALVHPYRGEGFGLPVAEAMACGLPVIVTRGGACDDFCPPDKAYLVDSRRQGVVFQGEETVGQAWQLEPDPASLRQQMRHVFEERGEARRRGLQGSAHIHSSFTWEDSANKAVQALNALNALDAPTEGSGQAGDLAQGPVAGADLQPVLPLVPEASAEGTSVAAIVLGQGSGESGPGDSALAQVVGAHARYAVDTETQHVLGEQMDAIRKDLAPSVKLLFILAGDVEIDAEDVRAMIRHFEEDDRLGLLIPERQKGTSDAQIGQVRAAAVVDSPCCVIRAEALEEIGGFDAGFTTLAVMANVVRALHRRQWHVHAASDVLVEEDTDDHVVAFDTAVDTGASVAQVQEMTAVAALEDGDRHRAGGDTDGAIERYAASLAAKEDFVEALLVLADAYLDADRATEAAQVAARLPGIDPASAWAHNFSALVHARAGDLTAAQEGFSTAVELNPDLTEARVNLAVMAWEAGQMETALEHFRHACERDPYNRDLICNLGLIYTQTGDTQEAVDLYQAYLGQAPDDVEVLGRLAEVQWQRQETDAARETASRLLRIDPDHERARTILQHRVESG